MRTQGKLVAVTCRLCYQLSALQTRWIQAPRGFPSHAFKVISIHVFGYCELWCLYYFNGFQFEKFAVSVAIRSRQHKVKVEVQGLIREAIEKAPAQHWRGPYQRMRCKNTERIDASLQPTSPPPVKVAVTNFTLNSSKKSPLGHSVEKQKQGQPPSPTRRRTRKKIPWPRPLLFSCPHWPYSRRAQRAGGLLMPLRKQSKLKSRESPFDGLCSTSI